MASTLANGAVKTDNGVRESMAVGEQTTFSCPLSVTLRIHVTSIRFLSHSGQKQMAQAAVARPSYAIITNCSRRGLRYDNTDV